MDMMKGPFGHHHGSPIGGVGPRQIFTILSVLIMFSLLTFSVILYIDNEGGLRSDASGGSGSGDAEFSILLEDGPEGLLSGSDLSFSGNVVDEEGKPVGDAVISLSIPGLVPDEFRSHTDPEGRFSLSIDLPPVDASGNFTVILNATITGVGSGSNSLVLEYIPPPTWTFMVYMSDCDLEAWALKDMNEMERIGSSENVNIVVQLDRWSGSSSKDDVSDGNWTTAKRFLIRNDDDPLILHSEELSDLGEIDSSDPSSLSDFAIWTMESFPADRYALILWNHGSGVDGVLWEQSLDNEKVMSIDSLGGALSRVTSTTGKKLDILGFDACLMSTVEVAYEMSPYAEYMIASEITEPAFGWDYRTLRELENYPYMSPEHLGALFVDDYMRDIGSISSSRAMTMGVIDLSLMDEVAAGVDELSNAITDGGPSELYNMRIARKYSKGVQSGYSSDSVDMYDFVDNILKTSDDADVKEKAERLLGLLDMTMIYFTKDQVGGVSIDGLNGLSIYAPDFEEVFDGNDDYDDLKMVQDTSWSSLLRSYYGSMKDLKDGKVLDFETSLFSCSTSDGDSDGRPDTMSFHFGVISTDDVEAFLGIDVFDLRGDHITGIGHHFNISSGEEKTFTVTYTLDEGEGGPGLYRISAYLCTGTTFDQRYYQDYTRSGYRWLEVRENQNTSR